MTMPPSPLNLYVWEDVLCDWTCGIVFAVAPSLQAALAEIRRKYTPINLGVFGFPEQTPAPTHVIPLGPDTPTMAWLVTGGA